MKKSILALLLSLLAVGARADSLWVYGANLQRSAAGGELAFTLIVNEPGTYQAGLEVQGERAQDYAVELVLQPEADEASVTTRFSFAGLDCGWPKPVKVTGGDLLQLQQGRYSGRLFPVDETRISVNYLVLTRK